MDDRVENITENAKDIYYGPGRTVDGLQVRPEPGADLLQDSLVQISDVLQDHYLPDIGPFEHPMDPCVDEMQRGAADAWDESQRRFNETVDLWQNTLETIVDTQQKAADEFFKRRLRVLEFRAGQLVEIFRD